MRLPIKGRSKGRKVKPLWDILENSHIQQLIAVSRRGYFANSYYYIIKTDKMEMR